jgi:hypothetical protein
LFVAWPIKAGDIVDTALDGNLPLETVIEQIRAHPVGPLTYPPGSSLASP